MTFMLIIEVLRFFRIGCKKKKKKTKENVGFLKELLSKFL